MWTTRCLWTSELTDRIGASPHMIPHHTHHAFRPHIRHDVIGSAGWYARPTGSEKRCVVLVGGRASGTRPRFKPIRMLSGRRASGIRLRPMPSSGDWPQRHARGAVVRSRRSRAVVSRSGAPRHADSVLGSSDTHWSPDVRPLRSSSVGLMCRFPDEAYLRTTSGNRCSASWHGSSTRAPSTNATSTPCFLRLSSSFSRRVVRSTGHVEHHQSKASKKVRRRLAVIGLVLSLFPVEPAQRRHN